MSSLPPEPPQTGGATGSGGKSTAPASYTLIASSSTVQVISPTVVNDVLYCTIETNISHVIASYPIPQGSFESVNSAEALTWFALGIEEIMALDYVIAGTGSQTLDANGLLSDNVVFTVQYVQPGTTGTTVTAEAVCPVTTLTGSSTSPGQPDVSAAKAIVDATLAGLQQLAGG